MMLRCHFVLVEKKRDSHEKTHKLPCTTACKECKSVGCENEQQLEQDGGGGGGGGGDDDDVMFWKTLYYVCNVMDKVI